MGSMGLSVKNPVRCPLSNHDGSSIGVGSDDIGHY